MKPHIKQIGTIFGGVALVIAAIEGLAQASACDPISESTRILVAQATVSPEYAQLAESPSEREHILVGHWRKTTIVFESPRDEHLVLMADGTAENWVVTASSRSATTKGTWTVEGKTLSLVLGEGPQISQPFTIYEGQLVFPNIPKRRGFWGKIAQ